MKNTRIKTAFKFVLPFILILVVLFTGHCCETSGAIIESNSIGRISNFRAVLDKNNNAKLTWKGNKSEGYIVYKFQNKKWTRLAKFKKNTSYSIPYNKIYGVTKFAVRGYNTRKKKEVINPKFETTNLTLNKVEGIKTNQSYNKVRLEWKKSPYYDAYTVYMKQAQDSSYKKVCDTYNNSQICKDLHFWCQYDFAVRGYKKINKTTIIKSDYTSVRQTTLTYYPLATYKKSGKYLNINWNKVKGASYYILYLRQTNKQWKQIGTTKNLSYRMKDPYPNDNYYITIRAVGKLKGKEYLSTYFATMVQPDRIRKTNQTLFACGDSIAFGYGSQGISYPNMLAEKYNLELTNTAISGATFSNKNKFCITSAAIQKANKNYKYALIEGGINDYTLNMPLGNITPSNTKHFDKTTACGGLESILYHFRSKYPQTKLYFVSVHNANSKSITKNKLGYTYVDYLDKYMKICKKYNVTVIDLYHNSKLNTQLSKNKDIKRQYTGKENGIYPTGDGLHPTEDGYKRYYMPEILRVFKK
ncbi:MAG: GDSL-type esterase/lipase family protein [Oscillospiraceae bacterium]